MIKIFSTECSGRFEVKFEHPDTSPEYYTVAVVCDDIMEDDFSKKLCEDLWATYNKSAYFHTMTVRSDYWIDQYLYVHETVYNGYEIVSEKCAERYKLEPAPFEVQNGVLYDAKSQINN